LSMVAPARPSTNLLSSELDRFDDAALLAMRVCDLPIRLDGLLARRVERLHRELKTRGIVALPHTWLSEEFFTPDGVVGFAIPFYLAHRRLMRLERSQMLEVEGAGEAECRRIFRHEAGHCLDEAYALHRRDRYRELFGDAGQEYPISYQPKPESRDYVINLAGWYAQGHPVEDFAETFAVWLNPYCDWRSDYRRWPLALRKLSYVDEIMREVAGKSPLKADRHEVEPLRTLTHSLREHYAQKRAYFAWRWPANYDVELRRIFSDSSEHLEAPLATRFLRRKRAQLRTRIAEGTGVHAYAVDQLLRQMIARSQSLGLRLVDPPEIATEKLLVLLSMQIATVVHSGYPKVAL
jgi:hypothetical protein